MDRLQSLSQLLDEISKPAGVTNAPVAAAEPPAPAAATPSAEDASSTPPAAGGSTYTVTYAPTYEKSHALALAAEFDRRLVQLEKGLGISESAVPEAGSGGEGLGRAVIPTLAELTKQLTVLSQASTANLDSISRRMRSMAAEQDKLNEAREKARTLREELGSAGITDGGAAAGGPGEDEETEQETKVKALYGIMPAIEGMAPILPPLLDRLRSLRAMHADAATAAERLDRIEGDQAALADELKQWRNGIDKMEAAIRDGRTTSDGNSKVIEAWAKDLEERIKTLG